MEQVLRNIFFEFFYIIRQFQMGFFQSIPKKDNDSNCTTSPYSVHYLSKYFGLMISSPLELPAQS